MLVDMRARWNELSARDISLDIDGVQIEGHWLGPGPERAPTLVFLHEGLGSAALWRDLPQRVATATGFGVFTYSRHGYGASTRKPHPWPRSYLEDEARIMLPRILEELAVRRVVLIGHSDGGSISAIAAGTPHLIPQLAGIALLAPHVMVEPATISGVKGAIEAFEKARLREHLTRYHGADKVDDAFWGWAGAWLGHEEHGWDVRDLLPNIHVPVMVVQGEDDEFGSADQYNSIAERVSGPVEVRVLPRCRHLLYRDRPYEVVEAVVDLAFYALNEQLARTA